MSNNYGTAAPQPHQIQPSPLNGGAFLEDGARGSPGTVSNDANSLAEDSPEFVEWLLDLFGGSRRRVGLVTGRRMHPDIGALNGALQDLTLDHLNGDCRLAIYLVDRQGNSKACGYEIKGGNEETAQRLLAALKGFGLDHGVHAERVRKKTPRVWLFFSEAAPIEKQLCLLNVVLGEAGVIGKAQPFPTPDSKPVPLPYSGHRSHLLDANGKPIKARELPSLLKPIRLEGAPRTAIPPVIGTSISDGGRDLALKLPDGVWRGPLQLYLDYVVGLEGCDAYDLYSMLAAVGIVLGRHVWVNYAGRTLYPNLYVVLFGPTGKARKTAAARRCLEIAEEVDPGLLRLSNVSSAEGLLQQLGDNPNNAPSPRRLIVTLEEFYTLLKKARQDSVANIIPLLTELYDCPREYQLPTRKNPLLAVQPTLSILACTTPDWLERGLEEEDIAGGFAGRMMYIAGEFRPPNSWPQPRPEKREALVHALQGACAALSEPTEIVQSGEAFTVWDRFYREHYHTNWSSDAVGKMAQRTPEHVLKMAVILSVLNGQREISGEVMEIAIELGHYAQRCMISLFKDMALSVDARLEQKIIGILKEARRMTKSDLHKKIGGRITAARLNSIINGLVMVGRIRFDGKDIVWIG